MSNYRYKWSKKEANFGAPIETEVPNGTHITCESILKFKGKYVALRRPDAIPEHEIPEKALKSGKPYLYFIHGLPRWGETTEEYVKRVIKDQAGVGVKSFKVVDLVMGLYEDTKQWFIEPDLIVEIDKLPIPGVYGNVVIEVVTFTKDNIPDDFGWWSKDEIKDFLEKYDSK